MKRNRRSLAHAISPSLWLTLYRYRERLRRLRRGLAYACGRLTADDAQTLMLECRSRAGWYPLLILSAEDALEDAQQTFVYHPELPRLIFEACATVEAKWTSFGDELANAREWAIRLAERYAREDGLILTRQESIFQAADSMNFSDPATREI